MCIRLVQATPRWTWYLVHGRSNWDRSNRLEFTIRCVTEIEATMTGERSLLKLLTDEDNLLIQWHPYQMATNWSTRQCMPCECEFVMHARPPQTYTAFVVLCTMPVYNLELHPKRFEWFSGSRILHNCGCECQESHLRYVARYAQSLGSCLSIFWAAGIFCALMVLLQIVWQKNLAWLSYSRVA